ncbi:histone H2A-Bbd type 2/3-like [Manis pentadactyla]|uniref:histone H2A-Bbd type 2/3-like n=1 Tax=Manis pentadactyla TaxID=143292 RepID=UPI00255CFA62|nr:histone H2A-Bbd type 2/3-like [Manis pentadactyla]
MPRHRHRRCRASSGGQRMTRSHTNQAELLFSVSHVECILREGHYVQHVSPSTPVFLAAVIQYLMAKVLELVGKKAQTEGSRCITPEIMDMVLHSNRLLSSLFRETTFSHVAPAGQ